MNRSLRFLLISFSIFAFACREDPTEAGSESVPADSSQGAQVQESQAEAATVQTPLTYAQQKGKRLYDHYCAVCHGSEGQGDGFNAYNLNPRPRDMSETGYLAGVKDTWLAEAISQGGRGVKRSLLMPSYEKTLTSEQIDAIVAYLRTFAQTQAGQQ